MTNKSRFAASIILCGLAAGACQDLPSAPAGSAAGDPAASAALARAFPADAPFVCYTSYKTPTGGHAYSRGRVVLHVPARLIRADGRARIFRVRIEGGVRQELAAAANCRIPASREAAEWLYRVFGRVYDRAKLAPLPPEVGEVSRFYLAERRRSGARLYTGGDPCSAGCILPPLTAVGTPSYWGGGASSAGAGGDWGSQGDYYTWEPADQPDPPTPCATGNPVIDAPATQAALDQAWQASNADATEADRREQGGFVIFDGSNYSFEPFQGNIEYFACSIKFNSLTVPANAVAMVHTHPYAVNDIQQECAHQPWQTGDLVYKGRLNRDDRATLHKIREAGRPGMVGYFIDKNGISEYTDKTHVNSYDARYNRCGF